MQCLFLFPDVSTNSKLSFANSNFLFRYSKSALFSTTNDVAG